MVSFQPIFFAAPGCIDTLLEIDPGAGEDDEGVEASFGPFVWQIGGIV